MMAVKVCDRCGALDKIENHHKKHKADGGSDGDDNLRALCMGCHDYQHAIDATLKVIGIEEARLKVLYKRLEVIEQENPPLLVKERGYTSYWDTYKKGIPSFADKWRCSSVFEYVLEETPHD